MIHNIWRHRWIKINSPHRINMPSPRIKWRLFPFSFIFSPLGARWGHISSLDTDYLWLFANFSAITDSANDVNDFRRSFFRDDVEFLRILGSKIQIKLTSLQISPPTQTPTQSIFFLGVKFETNHYYLPFTSVKSLTLDLLTFETLESFRSFSGGGVVGVLSVGGVNGVGGSLPSLSDVGLVLPLLIFVWITRFPSFLS